MVAQAVIVGAGTAAKLAKGVQVGAKELFGYDFIGLIVKLFIFQLVALLIAKFIETVLGANTVIKGIAGLLGYSIPKFLPQQLTDFFTNGWMGVRYWDVIKGISITVVIMEYSNYRTQTLQQGQEPSPATEAVFYLIIGFFLIITVPELYNRITTAINPLRLSVSSGQTGTTFEVSIVGLKALNPVLYGWKNQATNEIIFERELQIGSIFGVTEPFTFQEEVLSSTAPGKYSIYFDQTNWGGLRYEQTFEVLEGIAV